MKNKLNKINKKKMPEKEIEPNGLIQERTSEISSAWLAYSRTACPDPQTYPKYVRKQNPDNHTNCIKQVKI